MKTQTLPLRTENYTFDINDPKCVKSLPLGTTTLQQEVASLRLGMNTWVFQNNNTAWISKSTSSDSDEQLAYSTFTIKLETNLANKIEHDAALQAASKAESEAKRK